MKPFAPATPAELSSGAAVGDLRVASIRPGRLVLAAPQGRPLLLLAVGIAALIEGFRSAVKTPTLANAFCFFIALLSFVMAASTLGFAYVVTPEALCRRRLIRTGQWRRENLEAVIITHGHRGPRPMLRLEVLSQAGRRIVLTMGPDGQGEEKIGQAAHQIGQIMNLPVRREGDHV